MSSCNIHPLENHLEWRTAEPKVTFTSEASSRYTKHTTACLYQSNIELMASESSLLLSLQMQHVSIQTYSSPNLTASRQQPKILDHPLFCFDQRRRRSPYPVPPSSL